MNFVRYRMISSTDAFPRPGIFLMSAGFMKSRRSGASIEQSISAVIVRSLKPLCRNGNGSNTGRADVATFHATPVFFSQVLCPLCQLTHEWFAKDAWICDMPGE